MIFLVIGIVFLALCTAALLMLRQSHRRVKRLLNQLDQDHKRLEKPEQAPLAVAPDLGANLDTFAEIAFTRSLLALSRVRLLDPYDSPAPSPSESSSSESFHPVQSQTPDQAL